MELTIVCSLISFFVGVLFHAAITGWYERVKDEAILKLHNEIASLKARL